MPRDQDRAYTSPIWYTPERIYLRRRRAGTVGTEHSEAGGKGRFTLCEFVAVDPVIELDPERR